MREGKTDIRLLWSSLLYEVSRATASLMYLLQGMESARNSELPAYKALPPAQKQFAACFPKLPYVDVPLSLSGITFDLEELLKREGEAEQLAFKGWIEQVYNCIWESRYRNELKESLGGSDITRPQGDPIGDLRLIRNDLIHNGGVASVNNIGKCRTLKWFKPDESIILGMHHVFDFLNQMAFMSRDAGFHDDGANASWSVFPGMEETLTNRPTPKLVSLRTTFDKELEDGSTWHVVSVVFENGVFVNIPVDCPPDDRPLRTRIESINKTRIDKDGNVRFPNGIVKDRVSLYREAVDALLNRGPKLEGRGVPGPAFRFRR